MSTAGEVIVVGGGLAGVAAAHELARRGRPVRLIEAREGVALETSFANGGMLTPSMADPWNAPGVGRRLAASLFDPRAALKLRPAALPSLALWGLAFWRNSSPARHRAATLAAYRLAELSRRATVELRERLGLVYDAAQSGTMKVFRAARPFAEQTALARLLEREGLRVEVLDQAAVVTAEPLLAPVRGALVGGLRYPDDETGDAHLFTRALAERFIAKGGVIETETPVETLIAEGGKIAAVRTPRGDLAATSVVLAAGPASPALLRPLRLAPPIRPAKGYSLTFPAGAVSALPRLPVVDEALHVGVVPIGERLRLVGFAEFAGADRSVRAERIEHLLEVFAALYPELARGADRGGATAWTGSRPMSANGLPFIGQTRIAGLWLDTGHGHLGWTLAAGSARLLADLMDGVAPPIDPTPYRADR